MTVMQVSYDQGYDDCVVHQMVFASCFTFRLEIVSQPQGTKYIHEGEKSFTSRVLPPSHPPSLPLTLPPSLPPSLPLSFLSPSFSLLTDPENVSGQEGQ